jgi:hypothetical protein
MFKLFLTCIFVFSSLNVFSLEIDEKLTIRILNASASQKTILVNRGIEDGLVLGDHAKFFITVGVIARGVAIKVSPTRSVWSIYRLVNADYIKKDQVINLKITAPVKITQDESKMVVKDDTPALVGLDDPRKLGIPLSEGADDLGNVQVAGGINESELKALAGANVTNIRQLWREVFAGLQLSSTSSATAPGSGDSYASSSLNIDLMAGAEFYFIQEREWYGRFSFMPFLKMTGQSNFEAQGALVSSSTREIGGNVNWHPLRLPSLVNVFIPYATFGFSYGSVIDRYNPGSYSNTPSDFESTGSLLSFAFGAGIKFYTGEGYGARAVIEYFSRTDSFVSNDFGENWTRTISGPRFYASFSYRF